MSSESMDSSRRIDVSIRSAHNGVLDLFDVDAEWDSMTKDEQIDYSLEWIEYVGKMNAIERFYQAGKMTEEQVAAYGRIKGDLRRALPILERCGLAKPRLGEWFS